MNTHSHSRLDLHSLLHIGGIFAFILLLGGEITWAESPTWQQLSFGGDFSQVRPNQYQISSDSRWVVFSHDPDFENVDQLYSVPLDGSAPPQRISGLLGASSLGSFEVTPDGARVVYTARQDDPENTDLYRVSIEGGTILRLNLPGEGSVGSFRVSPDGTLVAYVSFGNADISLSVVPLAGGTPTLLTSVPYVSNQSLSWHEYRFTPTSDRIVFGAYDSSEVYSLHSVAVQGGSSMSLGVVSDGGDNTFIRFEISPDGQSVVYPTLNGFSFDGLYSVPVNGGTRTSLLGALPGRPDWFRITADSSRVVHLAQGHQGAEAWGLYSTPIGGGLVDLVANLGTGNSQPDVELDSSGNRLVFTFDYETAGIREIFSVSSAGGAPVKLNPTLPGGASVSAFKISADSQWVVYRADQLLPGAPMLWHTPIGGPASENQAVFFGSPVSQAVSSAWRIDPRSDRVVVLSNLFFVDGVRRPWRAFFTGQEDELVDETEFVAGGEAITFRFAPNGDIVYRADQNLDQKFELFSVTFPPDQIFADGFESGDVEAW
ncbi:MAG: DPP IV N-terminal domain-containing protein [Thermoanaerobaculia bacterium]|nr:DPP IV N-terminal domain-containing protein [Thermoanaerobaculia bacterium]